MYTLRYYQEDAKNSIFEYFTMHSGNPVVAMPTGTGKSLVIADFIKTTLRLWPNQRILMLTHVKELIAQNLEKLKSLWPGAPIGVYSAGMKRKEPYNSIVLGGIQSVARLLKKNPRGFGMRHLILIDECHLLSPNQETQYQKTINILKEINPYLKVIGFTATPYRMKVGSIAEGGGLFDGIAYDLCSMENFNRLVAEGWICPLIPKRPDLVIDTSSIKVTAGEFNRKSAQEVVDTDENTYKAIEEIIRCGCNRKSWLIFAAGIEHAEHICGMLQSFGIDAATTHSKLSSEQNTDNIEAFKSGKLRAIVNNNKLTTGFDYPGIDLIGMLRPTKSVALWVQMLGRGTRPAPGKENCLALDFVGNTERLGPINDPVLPLKPGQKKRKGEVPIKVCGVCGMYCHSSARVCPCCNTTFPVRDKIKREASSLELIRTPFNNTFELPFDPPEIKEVEIQSVTYHKYKKRGANTLPTMRVTYIVGLMEKYQEWLCFDHTGIARRKAESWWLRRSEGGLPPPNVEEAVKWASKLLKQPRTIRVSISKNEKIYPEILDVKF